MSNELMKIGDLVKIELKHSKVITSANYSFENALKSAALILTETVDRNKQPALKVCTPESIQNAILNMALQGLNPAKNQCYFVVYGQQLQCIRSYMGAQMTAKLVNPAIVDIRAQVIYQGDDVDIDIENGRDVVKKHKRKFDNINKADIIGAYAVAVGADEKQLFCEIMSLDEIKASWKQSKMSVVAESGAINQQSTHGRFTGEMSRRTVINRLCKRIINTSDDSALLSSFEASDEDRPEVEIIQEEIDRNANQKLIDLPTSNDVVKPEMPEPAQATDSQCRTIFELEKKAGRHEKILETISGFVGREINGLKELNRDEASEYIAVVEGELANEAGPDWA